MDSLCRHHHHHHDHHHKLHHLSSLQDLNIPPRKLLHPSADDDAFDPDSDPYSSDHFRMYEFKVRKCTRSRSHDWTDCPFAHPGEKARRRDPRRFHYSGTVCPEYRRSGSCSRGDECEFAHGVFECWLHPARYRTEACKDGKGCKRKVCFFAHSSRELRVLPATGEFYDGRDVCGSGQPKPDRNAHSQHCCRYCCALSPTSTLLGMSHFSPPISPSLSPPLSPMKTVGLSGFSPVSRYSDLITSSCGSSNNTKGISYEDVLLAELLGSLEGLSVKEAIAGLKSGLSPNPNKGPGGLWVDVGYDNASIVENPTAYYSSSSSGNGFSSDYLMDHEKVNGTGLQGPDLGWVNDLLM